MRHIFSVLVMCICAPAFGKKIKPAVVPELALGRAHFVEGSYEISGIWLEQNQLFFVSDDKDEHQIFATTLTDLKNPARILKELSALKGYSHYKKTLKKDTQWPESSRRLDFEGLSKCGEEIYLVNERVRHVLGVKEQKISRLSLKIPFDLLGTEENTGFEGIAIDCTHKLMYLALERRPRRLFKFDLDTLDLLQSESPPPAPDSHAADVDDDFSDLSFFNGYLYALERNSYMIAKIDPKNLAVISRVSFASTLKDLYDTGEPFGIAEALFMDKNQIIVAVDNNRKPLSKRATQLYGLSGSMPGIFIFRNPNF